MFPDPGTTESPTLIGFCCWGAAEEVLASLVYFDFEATGSPRLPRQVDARSIESPAL
jgi:hypothetical protein